MCVCACLNQTSLEIWKALNVQRVLGLIVRAFFCFIFVSRTTCMHVLMVEIKLKSNIFKVALSELDSTNIIRGKQNVVRYLVRYLVIEFEVPEKRQFLWKTLTKSKQFKFKWERFWCCVYMVHFFFWNMQRSNQIILKNLIEHA